MANGATELLEKLAKDGFTKAQIVELIKALDIKKAALDADVQKVKGSSLRPKDYWDTYKILGKQAKTNIDYVIQMMKLVRDGFDSLDRFETRINKKESYDKDELTNIEAGIRKTFREFDSNWEKRYLGNTMYFDMLMDGFDIDAKDPNKTFMKYELNDDDLSGMEKYIGELGKNNKFPDVSTPEKLLDWVKSAQPVVIPEMEQVKEEPVSVNVIKSDEEPQPQPEPQPEPMPEQQVKEEPVSVNVIKSDEEPQPVVIPEMEQVEQPKEEPKKEEVAPQPEPVAPQPEPMPEQQVKEEVINGNNINNEPPEQQPVQIVAPEQPAVKVEDIINRFAKKAEKTEDQTLKFAYQYLSEDRDHYNDIHEKENMIRSAVAVLYLHTCADLGMSIEDIIPGSGDGETCKGHLQSWEIMSGDNVEWLTDSVLSDISDQKWVQNMTLEDLAKLSEAEDYFKVFESMQAKHSENFLKPVEKNVIVEPKKEPYMAENEPKEEELGQQRREEKQEIIENKPENYTLENRFVLDNLGESDKSEDETKGEKPVNENEIKEENINNVINEPQPEEVAPEQKEPKIEEQAPIEEELKEESKQEEEPKEELKQEGNDKELSEDDFQFDPNNNINNVLNKDDIVEFNGKKYTLDELNNAGSNNINEQPQMQKEPKQVLNIDNVLNEPEPEQPRGQLPKKLAWKPDILTEVDDKADFVKRNVRNFSGNIYPRLEPGLENVRDILDSSKHEDSKKRSKKALKNVKERLPAVFAYQRWDRPATEIGKKETYQELFEKEGFYGAWFSAVSSLKEVKRALNDPNEVNLLAVLIPEPNVEEKNRIMNTEPAQYVSDQLREMEELSVGMLRTQDRIRGWSSTEFTDLQEKLNGFLTYMRDRAVAAHTENREYAGFGDKETQKELAKLGKYARAYLKTKQDAKGKMKSDLKDVTRDRYELARRIERLASPYEATVDAAQNGISQTEGACKVELDKLWTEMDKSQRKVFAGGSEEFRNLYTAVKGFRAKENDQSSKGFSNEDKKKALKLIDKLAKKYIDKKEIEAEKAAKKGKTLSDTATTRLDIARSVRSFTRAFEQVIEEQERTNEYVRDNRKVLDSALGMATKLSDAIKSDANKKASVAEGLLFTTSNVLFDANLKGKNICKLLQSEGNTNLERIILSSIILKQRNENGDPGELEQKLNQMDSGELTDLLKKMRSSDTMKEVRGQLKDDKVEGLFKNKDFSTLLPKEKLDNFLKPQPVQKVQEPQGIQM